MPSLTQRVVRKAFKPFYPAYYRLLWGRSFPFAARLEHLVRAWEDLSARGDTPLGADAWEAEYASGRWDLLERPDERPRYEALVGRIHELAPRSAVLDVGCGEGLLAALLGADGYERFVGTDISSAAIAAAEARELPRARFVAADAEARAPDGVFDVIVFNECLYYFEAPLEVARRYREAHLRPGGLVLTSMFHTPRSNAIRRRLEREWPVLDAATVSNAKGAWTITAFGEDRTG